MIWEQHENIEGQPVFVTEVKGKEYIVAQLPTPEIDGWWLLTDVDEEMRALSTFLPTALDQAAGLIKATA